MFRKTILGLVFLFAFHALWAQHDNDVAYRFLTLPSSAKMVAMGGVSLLPKHNDVNQLAHLPALLDSTLHQQFAVAYANYFANAHYAQFAGAWHHPRWGSFAATLQELNYGAFVQTNEAGEREGEFYVNEIAFMLHYAQHFSPIFHFGISAKTMVSQWERYRSVGMAMDIALRYQSLNKLTAAAFSVKNVGGQISAYAEGQRQSLPFEVQLAATHKFEAAPFGISLALNNLQRWDLYQSPQTLPTLGEEQTEHVLTKAGKEFLSHLLVGVGLYPSERFFVMAGYNYFRSNELAEPIRKAGSGISLGAGLRVKFVEITYAWGIYHLAGDSHNLSLLFSL